MNKLALLFNLVLLKDIENSHLIPQLTFHFQCHPRVGGDLGIGQDISFSGSPPMRG